MNAFENARAAMLAEAAKPRRSWKRRAAALTGAHFAAEASSFFEDEGPPPGVGQFLIALDPGPFSDGSFGDRLEVLLGAIEAEPGARLPGTRRLVLRRKAAAEGILVPAVLLERLQDLASA